MDIGKFVKSIPGWEIACRKENQTILSLYNSLSMAGGTFNIRFVKDPDYFEFNKYESDNNYVMLAKNDDGIAESMFSLMVRPCYINGEKEYLGHFSDLRSMRKKDRQSKASWLELASALLKDGREFEELYGCRYFIGSFVADNKYAIQAIRDHSPWEISVIASYQMVSILARRPLKFIKNGSTANGGAGISVTQAGSEDIPELKIFLNKQSRERTFGFIFEGSDCELDRRFDSWDGFSVTDFLIARDSSGDIAATFSCWDPSAGRKIVVDRFPASLQILGKMLKLFGKKIPKKGSELEVLYLSNIEFNLDYPMAKRRQIFNLLLDALYKTGIVKAYHILAFCDYETENLSNGMEKEYLMQKTRTLLYQMYDKTACDDLVIVSEDGQKHHVGHEMVLT